MDFQFFSGDPALVLLLTMIGFVILVIGRQIFWVFLAGLGFALGLFVTSQYYTLPEWQIILFSSIIAALGALLANTLQRLSAGIAGFVTAWYLVILLLGYFSLDLGKIEILIPYIVGAICGGLLMAYFDWGVIIASSLAGSAIAVNGMSLAQNIKLMLLIMLALLGIAIQAIWFMQEQ